MLKKMKMNYRSLVFGIAVIILGLTMIICAPPEPNYMGFTGLMMLLVGILISVAGTARAYLIEKTITPVREARARECHICRRLVHYCFVCEICFKDTCYSCGDEDLHKCNICLGIWKPHRSNIARNERV
jgi:hypothetical protein